MADNTQYVADRIELMDVMLKYAKGVDERDMSQALHYLKDKPDTTLTLWATYVTDMKRIDGAWKIARPELVSRGTRVQTG